MKTILAVAALFVAVGSTSAALAQQTGRVPIPPPARPTAAPPVPTTVAPGPGDAAAGVPIPGAAIPGAATPGASTPARPIPPNTAPSNAAQSGAAQSGAAQTDAAQSETGEGARSQAPILTIIPGAVTSGGVPVQTQTRPPASRQQQAASLLLELETTREGGRFSVAIYNDADAFRRGEQPVRSLMVERDGTVTRAWVLGMAPGRYAVAVFQDADGNGRLSKWPLGLAREPYGFSNNARGRTGPPPFEVAAFDLPATGTTQRIQLRDPLGGILR